MKQNSFSAVFYDASLEKKKLAISISFVSVFSLF